MTPKERAEFLGFIKGLENHIKGFAPELIENEEFFKENKEDGSR